MRLHVGARCVATTQQKQCMICACTRCDDPRYAMCTIYNTTVWMRNLNGTLCLGTQDLNDHLFCASKNITRMNVIKMIVARSPATRNFNGTLVHHLNITFNSS